MNLSDLAEYINNLQLDLTAEFLSSCLIENEIGKNEIIFSPGGQLKRKWASDIEYCEVKNFENKEEAIVLFLNRDGLYDSLPEALFFEPSNENIVTGDEMAKESMKFKTEEKETRSFFLPLESEIMLQRAKISLKENQIFRRLNSDYIQGIISDFWKIDLKIPELYRKRLFSLLPFADKITTDFKLIAQSLSYVLGEKVDSRYDNKTPDPVQDETTKSHGILGQSRLGNDFVCGDFVNGFINQVTFVIGPVHHIKPHDFLPGKPVDRLLDCFYSYFVPVELDMKTDLIFSESESRFVTASEFTAPDSFLGYNTILNQDLINISDKN